MNQPPMPTRISDRAGRIACSAMLRKKARFQLRSFDIHLYSPGFPSPSVEDRRGCKIRTMQNKYFAVLLKGAKLC
jgi:hypothetical protein